MATEEPTMELISESVGEDLTVREFLDENGETVFQLDAPDGTPMGDFLASYAGREEEFAEFFLQTIEDRLNELEKNGRQEQVPVGVEADREQAQEDQLGSVS